MSQAGDERASNKELVLRFLDRAHALDVEAMAECWAEECVRYGPRPSSPMAEPTRGRDELIRQIPGHVTLYTPGTLAMELEHIVAEGSYVAVQFVLRATTAHGEPYENYYHHLFECRDGRITAYWEYVDTQYAQRMLFDPIDHS